MQPRRPEERHDEYDADRPAGQPRVYETSHLAPPARSNNLVPIIIVGAICLLLGGGAAFFFARNSAKTEAALPAPTALPSSISTLSGPGLLRRIQALNKLETLEYRIETVVTAEKAGSWYKGWQDAQRAVFIANGTVTAGVDLSKLDAGDVVASEDGKQITVTLPPAEISDADLDKTRIYNVETGIFDQLTMDPQLLVQAEADAKIKIQQIACESDILRNANDSAERQVQSFASLFSGDAVVIVNTTNPSPCATPTAQPQS